MFVDRIKASKTCSPISAIEFPLLSLDEAVSRMDAGDTCYLRGGRYRQSITLSNKDDLQRDMTLIFNNKGM